MVVGPVSADLTRCSRFADHLPEVAPFGVAKQVLKIATQPVFDAALGDLRMVLEGLCQ